ncbi:MAG: hypothetical protein VB050_04295 [Geobacteraceae bacterium]|nr:hypothetical protein [Geobacteraceae bacterium]
MSKNRRLSPYALSEYPALFATEYEKGLMDLALGFRQGLSNAIRGCGKDRYQIAGEISRLTESNLSKDMLDKFTASDPAYGMKCETLPAFCRVVGVLDPFHYLLEPLGADVLLPCDRDLIELARLQEERQSIDQRIMSIRTKRGLK